MVEIFIQNDQDNEFMVLQSCIEILQKQWKKLLRNLKRSTVKLEEKNSHLMFDEISYFNLCTIKKLLQYVQ